MSDEPYCVYIMSNLKDTVLYVGVTSDLHRRVGDHRERTGSQFASKYNCIKLVYFEQTSDVSSAIEREKEIKGWNRWKKDALIDRVNPERNDLGDEI